MWLIIEYKKWYGAGYCTDQIKDYCWKPEFSCSVNVDRCNQYGEKRNECNECNYNVKINEKYNAKYSDGNCQE